MNNNPFYHILLTPFGYSGIIYNINPFYVSEVILPYEDQKKLMSNLQNYLQGDLSIHSEVNYLVNLFNNYFNKIPINTPWELLDLERITPLQKKVLEVCSKIPFGKTCSYKEIANQIGRPGAYRFAGTTLAKNRFPILIPCHRVIKSDKSLGQFGGGTDLKRKMIEYESLL